MTKLRSAADGAKSRFQSLQTTARAQRDRILTLEQEINTVQETSAAAAGTAETQLGAKDAEWQATRKSLEEVRACSCKERSVADQSLVISDACHAACSRQPRDCKFPALFWAKTVPLRCLCYSRR